MGGIITRQPMKISPIILATRAISSEFIKREYSGILWIVGIVLLILHILGGWLIAQSAWWWMLEIVFIVITLIIAMIATLVLFVAKLLRPSQTKQQHKKVKSFVDSLQGMAETASTPKFLLVYRLVKGSLSRNSGGAKNFISQVTSNSAKLKPDFQDIVRSFDNQA